MTQQAHKCVVCGKRPSPVGQYCHNCTTRIEKDKREKCIEQPVRFLTYRGIVVALYRNGEEGQLRGLVLKRNPDKLPKTRTLDLNTYLKGFTREQVKSLKAKVLTLAGTTK